MEFSSARVVAHFRKALSAEEDAAERLEASLKENAALARSISGLPHKTRHPIMVPFGRVAFFAGELVHTNELLVRLGEQLYAERSAKQAGEILTRRRGVLERDLAVVREKMAGLWERVEVAQRLAEADSGDFLEIREDYTEEFTQDRPAPGLQQAGNSEAQTVPAVSQEQAGAPGRGSADWDPDFSELMGRLEELEAAEERAAQGPAEVGGDAEGAAYKGDTSEASAGWGGEAGSREEGRSVAARSRAGAEKGISQKRVHFAEDSHELGLKGEQLGGPSAVRRNAAVAEADMTVQKGVRRTRPILGQVVERATTGVVRDSEDDIEIDGVKWTSEAPGRVASGGASGEGSSGSEGSGENDQEEEEADRRFFQELAAEEQGAGSDDDEWGEDEEGGNGDEGDAGDEDDDNDDDDDEGGPSLETGRQVSADIRQWLARAGPAPEGGRVSSSMYGRPMALEDARMRLRQRAEQARRQQGLGPEHAGSTSDDQGSKERMGPEPPLGRPGRPAGGDSGRGARLAGPVREAPHPPALEGQSQFASAQEKEAAFARFLSEDFAPEGEERSEGMGTRDARPERTTATVSNVVEKQEPPGMAGSLPVLDEPVSSSLRQKPVSRFKREMQRRTGGV